jgi:predicted transposase YbfD/YdcC
MADHTLSAVWERFATLQDPRTEYLCEHKLIDILTIALCALICGAETWVDVASFGQEKRAWLETFLELPNGIPSHDTFGYVFARLDTPQFERCFAAWMEAVCELTLGQVIAIDGKTLRRSHDRRAGKQAIHMVSAWASANRLVLGQVKVDSKSNEITAIPVLLRMLDVAGCIVTADAMGCQKEIAKLVVEKQGDYVLAVKDNQPGLHEQIQRLFYYAEKNQYAYVTAHDHYTQHTKDHGRLETRSCSVISDPDYLRSLRNLEQWEGLQTIVKVVYQSHTGDGPLVEITRYFISSLPCDAHRLLYAVRGHWTIEDSLHWVLDVAFREDDCRVRKDNGAENLAILRHIALNLLSHEKTAKNGIKGKRLKAGWSESYLLRVLSAWRTS